MASTREIRRRIRSVKNLSQITKAMEMVAASKMRKAQAQVLAARPYSEQMARVLGHLAAVTKHTGPVAHPLLAEREVKGIGLVVVTADRGLCGSMNTNVIREATQFILDEAKAPVTVISVGRKGRDYMVRHGRKAAAEFTGMGDHPTLADTAPITNIIIDDFLHGIFDEVYIVYTQFVNTLVQRAVLHRIIPLEEIQGEEIPVDYEYEPSPGAVLGSLLPRLVEAEVFHAILETIASEQSARMVAMRNATDNAKEMIDSLTLTFNKARQASITSEIAEVSSAAAAL